MKKIISVLLAVTLLLSSVSVMAFAVTADDVNTQLTDTIEKFNHDFDTKTDANGDGKLNAADARAALLYSAGLTDELDGTDRADIDGDGTVTAVDARAILRLSAGLDSRDSYYTTAQKLELFNSVMNTVKPNNTKYNYYNTDTTADITYDNSKTVDSFSKQVNALMSSSDDKLDLGKEITAGKGTTTTSGSKVAFTASETSDFPLSEKNYSSLLTSGDITNIVYGTNQSYTFTSKNSSGTVVVEPKTLTGLDSITIYTKNENLSQIPANTETLSNGKIFNVPQKEDIESGYKELTSSMDEMKDIVEKVGGTIDMSATMKSFNIHDSYVTVYFYHDTGKPVAIDYHLNYDFVISLYMNIRIILVVANLVINKQTINITTKEVQTFSYYFPNNYTGA